MYCSECGHKIDDPTIRFCPECGTPTGQPEESGTSYLEDLESVADPDSDFSGETVYGIILTNITLLSAKFGIPKDAVRNILNRFVEKKLKYGVSYRIVDAGNYTYSKTGFLSGEMTVYLDSRSSLEDYMGILRNVHETSEETPEYLFIIGGEDIIPMPRVKNWLADCTNDADVDTDMLYSYPYGKDVVTMTESMDIFMYEGLYQVGRLPLATDATPKTLTSWLSRDLASSAGIPVSQAYAQCDPNWMNVSARVSADLALNGLFPQIGGRLPEKYSYCNILLSPMVNADDGTADKVVNPGASLYYFNMHGSNALSERGYSGQALPEDGRGWYHGIMPEHLASGRSANLVVTEACYGARFEGLDTSHSMLLSALKASTLVFVGSSRVAWGAVDHKGATPETASMSSADILASSFIRSMLAGYYAGDAFYIARETLLQASDPGDPYTALTVTEFNLYGDPTLFVVPGTSGKIRQRPSGRSAKKSSLLPKGTAKKIVSFRKQNTGSSVLGMVRSAVDANMVRIHNLIGTYLYEQYGLDGRKPESVTKLKYSDGSEDYLLTYLAGKHSDGRPHLFSVLSSPEGKVKNVIATK